MSNKSKFDEVAEFRNSLDSESDRGCALMAASFLDSELDLVLRSFVVQNKSIAENIFGQSKPIGAFSARIDMAFLLGLLDSSSHRDFHLIRKIRNEFGHTHAPLSFETQAIESRCRELSMHFRSPNDSSRKVFSSCAVALLAIIHTALTNKKSLIERQTIDIESIRNSIKSRKSAHKQE